MRDSRTHVTSSCHFIKNHVFVCVLVFCKKKKKINKVLSRSDNRFAAAHDIRPPHLSTHLDEVFDTRTRWMIECWQWTQKSYLKISSKLQNQIFEIPDKILKISNQKSGKNSFHKIWLVLFHCAQQHWQSSKLMAHKFYEVIMLKPLHLSFNFCVRVCV